MPLGEPRRLKVIQTGTGSIRKDGTRVRIVPAEVHGRFQKLRAALVFLLVGIYVVLPFAQVDGRPAVHLSLARRELYLFGASFNAQDTWLAFFFLSGIGFSLVVLAATLASFFLIQGEASFGVMVTITYVAIAIYQAATGAIGPRLLPRAQYGQFSSANAVVFQVGWAISSVICGWFLDVVVQPDPTTGIASHPENYRYLFLWVFGFAIVGLLLTISVYRHWKKLGGDEGYEPPTVGVTQRAPETDALISH